jgi:hypothetical protein
MRLCIPLISLRIAEPIFVKFSIFLYIMPPESISAVYFMNSSHQSITAMGNLPTVAFFIVIVVLVILVFKV